MKSRILILSLLSLLSLTVYSQSKETIIDELEKDRTGQGVIDIESDDAITGLIGIPSKKAKLLSDDDAIVQMQGFRLMAYMSNDAQKGKTTSYDRRVQISEKFPEMEIYILYQAPNWKVLVGDFITRDEANIFRQQIQKEFPQFGKEVYIVNTLINVPTEKVN